MYSIFSTRNNACVLKLTIRLRNDLLCRMRR